MDLQPILTGMGGTPASPTKTNPVADAAQGFADVLREAETQAQAALTTGADPHSLVTAMAEGKMAIETVVSVRDRVVEAYQEILRMPV